ncbi:putative ribonuclease H protein [Vitis vinifera]|uniref:Putative ribonuclease H protein n=1 Tax=Vitis vinifera TaxID=29760 RepID=A0A438CAL9_VITVI|nr:putative ribonuclease H protein [Vitis vinifera]
MAFRGASCEEWNSRCFSTVVNGRLGVEGRYRGLDLNQISQQEADTLELPFTEEEVHSALMGMNGEKAPGPDGFTGAFWQFSQESQYHVSCPYPKKRRSGGAGGFQADQPSGRLYKLLAKVLANRIKNVVGKVVSSDQNAFVMDRQILDASLIANEVIDSWKKRGEKGLICKLDIEKAYDSVNWQFLMRVMQKWVLGGSARRPPIPILVYYGNGGVERLYSEGCGRGLHFRVQDPEGQGVAASGLRINLAKSEIIPVGEVEEILEMAVELGCKVGQLPSTYLGLPLGAPNKAVSMWDGVEERIRWKFALWKRQYISKGGRIALIKSTLASMPLYQMSLFRMPRVVARRLEKLQRDFLWGGGSTERKAHLVNWERVFAHAKEEMWKRVLVAKYGQEEFGWRTKKVNGAFGVGVWKEIMKEADWCWDKMNFKVGKGTKIRFWKDPWCGEVELARRFPQLFNVAAQRSATVGELWDHNSDLGSWNLRFSRGFNDWELNMVDELLQILRSQRITLEEDLALWKGGKNGKFEVKEAYELLISHSTLIFPKKGIWVENVPSKLAFFAWEATWGVARVLWGIVLGLVGAQWVFPETVKEAIEYVDHSSTLFKFYVLGEKVFYAVKKSTPNAEHAFATNNPVIPLHSLKSLPTGKENQNVNDQSIDIKLVTDAASCLGECLILPFLALMLL